MAECLLLKGGGGATTSDELTATRANVEVGKTAVTKDSDDEAIGGTLRNITRDSTIDHANNNTTTVVLGDTAYVSTNTDGVTRAEIRFTGTRGVLEPNTLIGIEQGTMASAGGLTAAKIMKNQSAFGIAGTATSDANAQAKYIRQGYTAYVNGAKITGSMTVSSLVSFNVATYSTTQVTATWRWPSVGPYSGIAICGKTGGYPSNINDHRVYTGHGSNYNLGATTSAIISGLSPNNTYYFRAWVYCNTSEGDLYSGYSQATAATKPQGQQTFTSSGIFKIDIFCVGGGGMGSTGYSYDSTGGAGGNGGSGGYTYTAKGVSVTPGQQVAVIVGAGATRSSFGGPDGSKSQAAGRGSDSSFGGTHIGRGGWSGGNRSSSNRRDGDGGSGGSGGATSGTSSNQYNGGSDGKDGEGGNESASFDTIWNGNTTQTWCYAYGQGSTTRAFGESSGTLYSGGGGAGAWRNRGSSDGTSNTGGGSGGGGAGGYNANGVAGSNGTGGGGGGGGVRYGVDLYSGGYGGSGCVIVRWGY